MVEVNPGDIAQIVLALGVGTIISSLINMYANRGKVGADTSVTLSTNALEWSKTAYDRAERADRRADKYLKRLQVCELHIDRLNTLLRRAGMEPPAFVVPTEEDEPA